MASRRITLELAAVVFVVAAAAVAGSLPSTTASAAAYRIGDDSGWDNGVDYDAWAHGKRFKVGDTLEFLYAEGAHNVVVVEDEGSFEACVAPANAPTLSSGDDTVALNQAGRWLFICSFDGHCQSGMKLAVTVTH
uniref:Phytocyanin domain-containing protein n=1 Tax=Oryza meridionalis TaxID=40149 RepID=A0A0E0D818_9ORYZ